MERVKVTIRNFLQIFEGRTDDLFGLFVTFGASPEDLGNPDKCEGLYVFNYTFLPYSSVFNYPDNFINNLLSNQVLDHL